MENKTLNSLTTIQRKISISSQLSNDHKFRKVLFEKKDEEIQLNRSIIYKSTMERCSQFNEKILEIQQYGADLNKCPIDPVFNQCGIDEPKRFQAKVTPNIQRTHSLSVNRSKSEHKTLIHRGRNFQGSRGKTMTATRFSNKTTEGKTLIIPQSSRKQVKSFYKKTDEFDLSRLNQTGQQQIKKTIQKKVRLNTNSLISLSSELLPENMHNRCIPLEKHRPSGVVQDNFLENTYRLRKCEIPVWYEISKLWNKAQEKRKAQKIKNTSASKQNKKIVYEGYDFNGQLIPSANVPQKVKKSLDQVPEVNVQFFKENSIQNLKNYHERQQRHAKTYKQIKINTFDCDNEESQFLVNLQRLQWAKNVEYGRRQQQVQQEKEKTKKSIKILRQDQEKIVLDQQKDISINNQNQNEETKINQNEELMEEFDKIKFGNNQAQVNESNNFRFGFSKYVKVKKFQQKQTKYKSYNYHTVNYFTTPYNESLAEIASTMKIKAQPNKGQQKVRANKILFKQVFNMSLKRIEPENREDVITLKLIKDQHKQNAKVQQKQRPSRNLRKHCARNSDTLLLKKGFCIKPTIFKQIKQNETIKDINVISDSNKRNKSQSKLETSSKKDLFSQSIQSKSSQEKTLQQGQLSSKVTKHNSRKSIGVHRQSVNCQDLQKLFKKQTKKTLIKQSTQDFRRQSFL